MYDYVQAAFAIETHFIFAIKMNRVYVCIACDTIFLLQIFLLNSSLIFLFLLAVPFLLECMVPVLCSFHLNKNTQWEKRISTQTKSNGNKLKNKEIVKFSQRLLLEYLDSVFFPTMTSSSYIYLANECLLFLITQMKS